MADLLKYADVSTGMTNPPSDKPMNWVPQAAARDTALVLAHLDPSHGHLRALKANAGNGDHVLPDADPQSRSTTRVALDATWTVDGVTPQVRTHTLSGTVQVCFGSDPAQLGLGGLDTPPGSPLPCGYGVRDLGLVSGPAPAWSTCTTKTLDDGSKLSTASAQFGPGTLTVAFREFPQGHGGIAIYATDYPPVGTATAPGPERAVVLSPSPFTPSALADALSDPALTPGLTRTGAAE